MARDMVVTARRHEYGIISIPSLVGKLEKLEGRGKLLEDRQKKVSARFKEAYAKMACAQNLTALQTEVRGFSDRLSRLEKCDLTERDVELADSLFEIDRGLEALRTLSSRPKGREELLDFRIV
jgi:hypothetical protein